METSADRLSQAIEDQRKLDRLGKQLTSNEQYVLNIIRANQGVQDDEVKLLEAVYIAQGWDDTKSLYWNLTRVMHPETVARARRKLHEYGLIEYSPDALRRRTKRYKEETERHSNQDITSKIVGGAPKLTLIDGEWVTVIK